MYLYFAESIKWKLNESAVQIIMLLVHQERIYSLWSCPWYDRNKESNRRHKYILFNIYGKNYCLKLNFRSWYKYSIVCKRSDLILLCTLCCPKWGCSLFLGICWPRITGFAFRENLRESQWILARLTCGNPSESNHLWKFLEGSSFYLNVNVHTFDKIFDTII